MLNSILTDPITLGSFLICIVSALVLGVAAALVFSAGSKYTSSWKISIALLPAVVSVVIMMVNGNIGTGLAVAGTFALVRFRSQPGSARELTGLFFAVALGLMCGNGHIGIAVIFFAVMAIATLLLTKMHFGEANAAVQMLKITIPEDLDYETIFDDLFEKYCKSVDRIRVRTVNVGTLYELTYDVVLKNPDDTKAFIDDIRCRNGNLNIILGRHAEDNMM